MGYMGHFCYYSHVKGRLASIGIMEGIPHMTHSHPDAR